MKSVLVATLPVTRKVVALGQHLLNGMISALSWLARRRLAVMPCLASHRAQLHITCVLPLLFLVLCRHLWAITPAILWDYEKKMNHFTAVIERKLLP